MTTKLKRTIAREGLIIIGVFIAIVIYNYCSYILYYADKFELWAPEELELSIHDSGLSFFLFYAVALVIRFIFWAIRTLKGPKT